MSVILLQTALAPCAPLSSIDTFLSTAVTNTVAGKGKISEPSTAGTSKLDWRCFEYY